MRPLVAVVGDTDRVPESALEGLRDAWRFERYLSAADVLTSGERPEVVVLASKTSRSARLIEALREHARPKAVLLGFGEDSAEDLPALTSAEGWVRLPITAQTLSARLAALHPRREDTAVRLPGSPPRQLGPFVLQRRLGVGSFGAVYQALDTRSGGLRAIKIAHPEVLAEPEARARWLREAKLLQGVRIPGVVTIHGSGEVDGFLCLVMDMLPGVSLHSQLRSQGPVGPAVVVRMAERLGRALGALHALGVIHRDVKPANIVVQPSGVATLVDLGLIRHLRSGQLTASDVILGTAGFLSPERIEGGQGDAHSDAYALAATLYFALTGRAPFVHKTALELIRRVSNGEPAEPIRRLQPNVPSGLAQLIDAMLLPRLESRATLSELVEWCFQATHETP